MLKKKVLIVDDEPDVVEVLSSRIQSGGFITYAAHDGDEAIEKAKREKPDLIILDIIMPKMDGYTCLKALKADSLTKDIPIIILTIKRKKKIGDLFRAEGINWFFEKPYNPDKLMAAIKDVLGQ